MVIHRKAFKSLAQSTAAIELPSPEDAKFISKIVEPIIEEIEEVEAELSKEDKDLADEIIARSEFNDSNYAAFANNDEDETEHGVVQQAIHDHIFGGDEE